MVDAAPKLQLVALLQDKTPGAVIEALEDRWLPWAGPPTNLVADQGREFVAQEFNTFCEAHGIAVRFCAVEPPWQNGIAERAGGAFKLVLQKVVTDHDCLGVADMRMATAMTCWAVNSRINETGLL